jgi:hypothetical protein
LLASACGVAIHAAPALAAKPNLVINVPVGGDIPTAVATAIYAGGGTINLAAGTYNLTSSIPMASNITINGQGSSTIILSPATPHGFPMIGNVEDGIGNIVLSNLVLDGNIPKGAYLPGGGGNPYGGAGLYLFASSNVIQPVTLTNVEIRHTSIGMLLGLTNQVTISHSYIHDNNPGGFSHNAYFVGCSGVSIDHSRFDTSWLGDGLHFDFGSSLYTITKSEFSGNEGEGILDQGNFGITITDTAVNGNRNDGLNTGSNGALFTRDIASGNYGFGFNNGGGSGNAYALAALNDLGGFGQFFGDNFGLLLGSLTPNVYPAILATGPIGPVDTADWTTAYPGYSTIGAVDFNARHLTDGLLVFTGVGVTSTGSYTASFQYSNGSGGPLTMMVDVNNAKKPKKISFPSTGGWSNWQSMSFPVTLKAGANQIAVTPEASGAPELDYLAIGTQVPPAPVAVSGAVAKAHGPYEVELTWPASAGAATYAIFRDGAPINFNVSGTKYTDTGLLMGGATHSYGVYAQNQGGSTAPAESVTVTTPADTPAGFQGSVATGGNVLNWISENGATEFKVLRSATPTGGFKIIAKVQNTASQGSSNYEQTYLDTSAVANQTYYYEVESVGPIGTSPPSYVLPVGTPGDAKHEADIGGAAVRGRTDYNAVTSTYGLSASGVGFAGAADALHFAYLPVGGKARMTARVLRVDGGDGVLAGIDIRASLAPGATHALVAVHAAGGLTAITRRTGHAGNATFAGQPGAPGIQWVRLIREGHKLTAQGSADGLDWHTLGVTDLDLPETAYLGLAVGGGAGRAAFGLFDTVTVDSDGHPMRLCRDCQGRGI